MDEETKAFVEKVKDEFKKVRAEVNSLKESISPLEAEIQSLKKVEKKDDSWF